MKETSAIKNIRRKKSILLLLVALLMTACEMDSYDKGEGKYSLMEAEFCQLLVSNQKEASSFITDEGVTYQLAPAITAKWMQTADTTYRAIIYFKKVSASQAECMSISVVPTLHPLEHWKFKKLQQDPIGFESAWLSKHGNYLNVGVLMKTGRIDDEEMPHNIGLAQDTVIVNPDKKRTAYYRLLHNQNNAPEYYTNRRYISIALPQPAPDTIRLNIQTYDGIIEKTLFF